MADKPGGFSSPMGGGFNKKSEAASAVLAALASHSGAIKKNMTAAADEAERMASAVAKGGRPGSAYNSTLLGMGRPASGGTGNGGGARFGTPPPGLTPPSAAYTQATYASGPSGAAQAWGRPLGGGANIPASPGSGGTPGSPAGTTDPAATAATPPKANGGGARMGSFGSGIRQGTRLSTTTADGGERRRDMANVAGNAIGGAMGAVLGSSVAAMDSYRDYDWLANRIAMNSIGGYDKGAAARSVRGDFGGGFRNAAELGAQVSAMNQGGFARGSSGWKTQSQSIRGLSMSNPMLAGQAGQIVTGFQDPTMYNRSRMFGIQTMGPGGQPLDHNQIARNLYTQAAKAAGKDPSATPGVEQVAAYFGPGGSLRQTMEMTMGANAGQIEAVQDSLRLSAEKGRWVTARDQTNRKGNRQADSMFGGDQRRAEGDYTAISSHLEEYAKGYNKTQDAIADVMTKLGHVIDRIPDAIREGFQLPGGIAAMTRGGGGVGNSVFGGIAGGMGAMAMQAGGSLLRRGGGGRRAARAARSGMGRMGLGVAARVAAAGGMGALGIAGGIGAGALAGVAALGYGVKGLFGADYSGDKSEDLASMWEHGLGGAFGFKADRRPPGIGDGPGRVAAGSAFPGIEGAGFRGKQWSDGIGDNDDAQSKRGGETHQLLEELMSGFKGGYEITSRKRTGKSGITATGKLSYHATGHALDIAGPTPVAKGSRTGSPALLAINRYLAQYAPGLAELIYSGPGGVNVHNGQPGHKYKDPTYSMHFDHVHVAATPATLKKLQSKKGGGPLAWLKSKISGAASAVAGALGIGGEKKSASKKNGSAGRGRSNARQLARRGGGSQADMLEAFLGGAGGGPGGSRAHEPDLSEANAGGGGGTGGGTQASAEDIDKFLYGLRSHESGVPGGDYDIENGGTRGAGPKGSGDTSASGAYQYLDSTWAKYRGYDYAAAAPPEVQDARARADQLAVYQKYGNWRYVAAAHFRGRGWLANHKDGKGWDDPVPSNPGMTTNKFIDKVLGQSGLPKTGDGPGAAAVGMAAPVSADVPRPRGHQGGGGGGGNMTVHSRGGQSVSIAKVEVHITTPQVSQAEAKRIGKMVVDQIAAKAREKGLSQ